MSFIAKVKQTLNNEFNVSRTENGALGYRTSGKNLLDLNFAIASLRKSTSDEIIKRFVTAFYDDRQAALTWLFYARDVRGGIGERRLFRIIFEYVVNNLDVPVEELISLVPEYGRFDDLLPLIGTKSEDNLISLFSKQLDLDLAGMGENRSISLLAKWLPTIYSSNLTKREYAHRIAEKLGMNTVTYRKTLTKLRRYLDIVELKMCAKQFSEIKYEAVPSRANLIYNNAFLRHDEERRREYLASLAKGETTINAGTLFPHDIVSRYMVDCSRYERELHFEYDETLEQLWKALPAVPELDNTIVVADGSGSMESRIGKTECPALAVANALAIYFAEHCSGEFGNKYITFSENPQLVDLSGGRDLREKLQIASSHNEVANTDIHAVFKLILVTAVKNHMKQVELPKNIVIISDMEFDSCTDNADELLFAKIARQYEEQGYKLPRLVFWNVNSRTGTIPVKENGLGVALVSGFSTAIVNMVLSRELDPYKCLIDILNAERYAPVRDILGGI